jgi:single-stranded-DNA-specific exonuclease
LNAAGRCGKAGKAVELLLTDNINTAQQLLKELLELNDDRKRLQEENLSVFNALITQQYEPDKKKLVFLTAHAIPHGVLGIIANRLVKKFNRPVALLIQTDDTIIGTMRSAQGFNVLSALEQCKIHLVRFGGHAMAAGFTLEARNLRSFKEHILQIADQEISDDNLMPVYSAEGSIKLEELDEKFIDEILMFEPYGAGWEYPKFHLLNHGIKKINTFGLSGKHLRMKVYNEFAAFDAVGWDFEALRNDIEGTELWDLIVKVEIAQKKGENILRLNIVDMKPSRVEAAVSI